MSIDMEHIKWIFSGIGCLCIPILYKGAISIYKKFSKSPKKQICNQKVKEEKTLYPHRLEFYTDFYKTLSAFKEYNTNQSADKIIKDMEHFFLKFETYKNQAIVLFDDKVIIDTIGWYNQIIGRLKNEPLPDISDAFTFADLKDKGMQKRKYFDSFRTQIEQIKTDIIRADKEDALKEHFNLALHLGGENE